MEYYLAKEDRREGGREGEKGRERRIINTCNNIDTCQSKYAVMKEATQKGV